MTPSARQASAPRARASRLAADVPTITVEYLNGQLLGRRIRADSEALRPARPERKKAVNLLIAVRGAAGEVQMQCHLDHHREQPSLCAPLQNIRLIARRRGLARPTR